MLLPMCKHNTNKKADDQSDDNYGYIITNF